MQSLQKLAAVGVAIEATPPLDSTSKGDRCRSELHDFLSIANGLYCFESALHLLPSGGKQMCLETWNAPDLWRDTYDDLTAGCFFFAEDVYGNQFAIREARIVSFEAETGQIEDVAGSLAEWAERIMEDYEYLSGYPLAHTWQKLNGSITEGRRLVPKIPFVLGGEFEVDNLHELDAVKGMRWRGDLAVQIRDLPDGASIELKVL